MRELIPTERNTTHLKAKPTERERALYIQLATAIRDAGQKVIDKHLDVIQRMQVTFDLDLPKDYGADLIDVTLLKQEGDTYSPQLEVSLRLRIPGHDNPDYDPSKDAEY